jgi:ribonucleoside-diphosphate reductase alpha chain
MNNWIENVDYPSWLTEEGLKTLERQHLLDNETPKEMYIRITETLYQYLKNTSYDNLSQSEIKTKWFNYLWNGWLAMSTPVASNIGTDRGLGISCYIEQPEDSLHSIYDKIHELAMLTKAGGGVGISFDKIRGRGEPILTGGFSEGTIPFMKVYDSAIIAASQGNIRRGSASINLPIRHKDIREFLKIREPKGDVNRQCLNLNHCVSIDDYFMESLTDNPESRELWAEILSSRMKTGQPYIMYYHNAHHQRPTDMVKRNLKINGTNLCSEIMLPHDPNHTVVCCLSSINISKFDEWSKDPDFLFLSYLFLDCVMEDFIVKCKDKSGFEAARNFAIKSRALGLGCLGWATFLQNNNIPFVSLQARGWINRIGSLLQQEGNKYNEIIGKELGSPEWCDTNRNLTLRAIAPNTTSSLIVGGVSQGIEPIVANVYIQKSAKGTFIRINPTFKKLMESKYSKFISDNFWTDIATNYKGSVQQLNFLTDEEKEVFLTAYEINQLELVKQAGVWQKYIDQGISVNLFFPEDVEPRC